MSHEEVKLMHELKIYPPRVTMTVDTETAPGAFVVPVKVDGCAEDGELDVNLMLRPQGMYYSYNVTTIILLCS